MNASEQIIQVLNELGKKVGFTIDWSQQNVLPQITDFMHRYAKYEIYTSIMWLCVGIIFLILAGVCVRIVYKITKEQLEFTTLDEDSVFIACFIGFLMFLVIGTCISICQINDIIQMKTIPEVYFINYVKTLLQ